MPRWVGTVGKRGSPKAPRIGATLKVTGPLAGTYSVTLLAEIKHPAGAGTVALKFRVTDSSAHVIHDEADQDATIIGSNDQLYSDTGDNIRGCTDFDGIAGGFSLRPNTSAVGCLLFQVSPTIAAKVQWSPDSQQGSIATWLLKRPR